MTPEQPDESSIRHAQARLSLHINQELLLIQELRALAGFPLEFLRGIPHRIKEAVQREIAKATTYLRH